LARNSRDGNLTKLSDQEEDGCYTITYDGVDRRIELEKPSGSKLVHDLDDAGNVEFIMEMGEINGNYVNHKRKRLLYDERNRLFREKTLYFYLDDEGVKYDITTGAHNGYTKTQYGLNKANEVVKIRDDEDRCIDIEFDNAGREVKRTSPVVDGFSINNRNYIEFEYDDADNITKETKHEWGHNRFGQAEEAVYTTDNEYDSLYRLEQTVNDPGGENQTWTYEYDSLGNKIKEQNPNNVGTLLKYDTLGKMTEFSFGYDSDFNEGVLDPTHNPDGLITTKTGYDASGNVLYQEDDNENRTEYLYDNINRKTRISYADGTYENLEYRLDNLLTKLSAYNASENMLFEVDTTYINKLKDMDEVSFGTGTSFSGVYKTDYDYDGIGRVDEITTENKNPFDSQVPIKTEIIRDYDSMDNIFSEEQSVYKYDPGIAEYEQISYEIVDLEYNGLKSRIRVLLDGYDVSYEYDELDRIRTINGNSSFGIGQQNREYAGPGGRITSVDYTNGAKTQVFTTGYDSLGRLSSLKHRDSGGGVICNFGYGYNITDCRLFETKGHYTDEDQGYIYDDADRLKEYNKGHYNPSTGVIDNPIDTESFGLDGVSNFITHDGNTNVVNDLNAYTTSFDGSVSLDYDERGNTTEYGDYDLIYDVFGRVVGVENPGTMEAVYAYDGFGRRLMKKKNSDYVFYVMEGDRVIQENEEGSVKNFVWGAGIDELVGFETSGSSYHAHLDALWSVIALTDEDGDLVERYDYDPYGTCEATDMDEGGLVGNPYLFTGRRLEEESGLYYYRARHYSSVMGRFLSRDPIGVWGDAGNFGNAYGYAGNNPLLNIDPLGLEETAITIGHLTIKAQSDDSLRKTMGDLNILMSGKAAYGPEINPLYKTGFDLVKGAIEGKTNKDGVFCETVINVNRTGQNSSTDAFNNTDACKERYRDDNSYVGPGKGSGSRINYCVYDEKASVYECDWNNENVSGGPGKHGEDTVSRPPFIALAHELAHAEDFRNGTAGWSNEEKEKYAIGLENKVRKEHGLKKRVTKKEAKKIMEVDKNKDEEKNKQSN